MSLQAKLMITLMLLGNAVLVIELLRKRRLTESYTLLWLLIVLCTIVAAWSDRFLYLLARFFGSATPISTLLLLSLVFILVMLIFFSMKISRLTHELKALAQQIALRTPPDGAAGAGRLERR